MIATFVHGWRNLRRNGRRTAITAAAVTASTAMLITLHALMNGMLQSSVGNATNLSVGEVQVHAPGYLKDRSIYKAIDDPDALLRAAAAAGADAAPRSYGYGLVASGTKSAGALFWGVDPARERAAFDLFRHMAAGGSRFLDDQAHGEVVLGRKLARSLDVEPGDELVVVVQAADGSLGNEIYKVVGVLQAVGEAVDRGAAILHRADFERLFVSGGRIHEIAVNSRGTIDPDRLVSLLERADPGQDVRSWRKLLPILSDMLAMMDAAMWIFAGVFFLAAGLGVMNTMLMATYERIREFGVLKAIGASPWRIACDVAAEALVLGVLATSLGAVLGMAASWLLEVHPINTASFAGQTSFAGVAFDPLWRAALRLDSVVVPVLAMWVTSVVAALYPAILAARLDPVAALHHT